MDAPVTAWRWRHLLLAPHRLAFGLAVFVSGCASAWWLAVQVKRGFGAGLAFAVPPTLTHAAAMTLGFLPLFFSGFLFTAGPRWLAVPGPDARTLRPALLAQAGGWLLWLAGAHLHHGLAAAGAALSTLGLAWVTLRFARMVRASGEADRLHAKAVLAALACGSACLAGVAACVAAGRFGLALDFVRCALWGCVVGVFLAVAHRMLPFFTSAAIDAHRLWRSEAVLALMLATTWLEAAAPWIERIAPDPRAWALVRGLLELASGSVLGSLALAWSRAQRRHDRLFRMLHLGFSWLAAGVVLMAVTHLAQGWAGRALLPLAGLHAVAIGGLGSLMLAMVTRVSCGQSGRAVVADGFLWRAFCALQLAVSLRVAAAFGGALYAWLVPLAALAWAGATIAWGARLAGWWGRPRADGRPG